MAVKYPFSPELLDALPEELAELFRGLEDTLLDEICSRLKIADQLNEVTAADIRALRSHGIGMDEIKKSIRETTGIGEDKLNQLLDDVVERNQQYYKEAINLAKVTAPKTLVDAAKIDAIRRQTLDTYHNLTGSMGFLVDKGRTMLKPAKAYQWALDNAEMQIMSGAINYNQAIKNAVKQLADSGIKIVEYESGHVDHADVAARRAVMTGINQLNQKYAEQSLEYLETDLVETTAHIGARNTGTGPANHESWQGKIYRWNEKPKASQGEYPDFIETTGYGTGEGLGGWNCRHTFNPFVEDVMEPTYSEEALEAMKGEKRVFTFERKEYDGYAATQKQRQIERTIRRLKREQAAYKAAGLTEDAQTATIRIQRLNKKYKEFSKAAGLPEQQERMRVQYADETFKNDIKSGILKSSDNPIKSKDYTVIDKTWKISPNDTEEISKAITSFEQSFSTDNREHSLVITKGGEIFSLTGTPFSVDPSIIGSDKLVGSIGVHNHPVSPGEICGDSFSRADLMFSVKYKTGIEYLVSGNRRNAFEFVREYTEDEIYNAWNEAFKTVREQALSGKLIIDWEQEEILKVLSEQLEGFTFYENF